MYLKRISAHILEKDNTFVKEGEKYVITKMKFYFIKQLRRKHLFKFLIKKFVSLKLLQINLVCNENIFAQF